jgi:hypothetical protein
MRPQASDSLVSGRLSICDCDKPAQYKMEAPGKFNTIQEGHLRHYGFGYDRTESASDILDHRPAHASASGVNRGDQGRAGPQFSRRTCHSTCASYSGIERTALNFPARRGKVFRMAIDIPVKCGSSSRPAQLLQHFCARAEKGKLQISHGLSEFVLQNWHSQSFGSLVLVRGRQSASTSAASPSARGTHCVVA